MLRLPYNLRKPEGYHVKIPKVGGLWYRIDCMMENLFIRHAKLPECGIYQGPKRAQTVTVSMTSFPARIQQTCYAVKSLMIQSVPADRIILWLAESQFENRRIPENLQKLVDAGLTIRWCADLRSHKKYYYALQEQQPDEVVITYDDDIIYEYDSLEKLLNLHQKFPEAIVCNRGHEIVLGKDGTPLPYSEWKVSSLYGTKEPARRILPSTGAGCLYPYGVMPPITFDWETVRSNALTADDIWMRFCSLSNQVGVIKTRARIATLVNVSNSQEECLTATNDLAGENQRVIDRLEGIFPGLCWED